MDNKKVHRSVDELKLMADTMSYFCYTKDNKDWGPEIRSDFTDMSESLVVGQCLRMKDSMQFTNMAEEKDIEKALDMLVKQITTNYKVTWQTQYKGRLEVHRMSDMHLANTINYCNREKIRRLKEQHSYRQAEAVKTAVCVMQFEKNLRRLQYREEKEYAQF